MSAARDEILHRIRTALADHPAPPPVPRDYRGAGSTPPDLELFTTRVADYRATIDWVATDAVATAVCAATEGERVVVPPGFPRGWQPSDAISDDPPLTTHQLDHLDAVVTTCVVAIAETGTIVLDHGPGQGRRALTLVPDHHVIVVRADQVVAAVPDAIAALDPTATQTWISGPSATSDIELHRVEGVHGPRRLHVLLVG